MRQTVNPVHLLYKITIGYTNRLCGSPVLLRRLQREVRRKNSEEGWERWFPPLSQLLFFPPIRTLGVEQAPYHFISIVRALFHFSCAAAKCHTLFDISVSALKGKIKKEDQLHCSRWLVGDTSLQLTRWFLMINTPVWRRTRLENSNNKTVLIQVFNYNLWLLKGKVNWQQYHHDTMFLNIFYESQIFRLDKDNCLFPVMHPLKNLLKELKLVMKLKYNKATIWIL